MNFLVSIYNSADVLVKSISVRGHKVKMNDPGYTHYYCNRTKENNIVQVVSVHDSQFYGTCYDIAVFSKNIDPEVSDLIRSGMYKTKVFVR